MFKYLIALSIISTTIKAETLDEALQKTRERYALKEKKKAVSDKIKAKYKAQIDKIHEQQRAEISEANDKLSQ